ncbi:MAG TPA: MarR family transcriptional regulator [Caulobacteraceae bacterium]|jgi:DNA-binding MarR family transcriptional regulator
MTRRAGVGPWPEAAEAVDAGAEPSREGRKVGAGTKISARLGALSVRMVATGSATYLRVGLGSVEARVLLALGPGPQTSSQIGKLIGVDRAAVCRAVSSLLERDLVLKLDGRARSVRLTAEGEALIEGINRVTAERERRLLAGLSDDEVAALLGFLGRLMLNVPALTELAESRVFEALRD